MKKLVILITSLLWAVQANATLMSVELDSSSYMVGDVATANIVISDIEQEFGFQKLLASFEFDLTFNNTQLGYRESSFGNLLDVDPLFPSSQFTDSTSVAGEVYMSELSLAFGPDLFFAQSGLDSFTLASVSFDVLASGTSMLELTNVELGDDLGIAFSDIATSSANLTTNSINVSEPSSLAIFGLSLLLLLGRKAAK